MGYYISCRYILLQKKLDLKVVKLYPLHSQGSFVFVHSIRIISLKMSDSTKERFYFIQNKFIWNYFYTIGDYNKYLNTIRRLIGRCNRYFRRWLYFNPSGFRYDPLWFKQTTKNTENNGIWRKKPPKRHKKSSHIWMWLLDFQWCHQESQFISKWLNIIAF